jgi:N-formylglutamate deformylase
MELFNLHLPTVEAIPIVANLPHSGMFVPDSIAQTMLPEHLTALPNTDWHLERLYDFLPQLGITVLQATHSRYVVDLNRALREPLFGSFWSSIVPQETAFGQPIYQTLPSQVEIRDRIDQFYKPYHAKLDQLLRERRDRFGKVYLLDLHSFMGLITDQVCLGNSNGKTCSEQLISGVEHSFTRHNFQVVRNKVFTGGWITKHYGQLPDTEALQIEIRYPVYLKSGQLEQKVPPMPDVPELSAAKVRIAEVFRGIVQDFLGTASF